MLRRGRWEIIWRMLIIVQSLPIEAFIKTLKAKLVIIIKFIASLATSTYPARPWVNST
jgi:hypothetical protein